MEKNVNQFDVRHMASVVKTRVVGLFALPNTSLADLLANPDWYKEEVKDEPEDEPKKEAKDEAMDDVKKEDKDE